MLLAAQNMPVLSAGTSTTPSSAACILRHGQGWPLLEAPAAASVLSKTRAKSPCPPAPLTSPALLLELMKDFNLHLLMHSSTASWAPDGQLLQSGSCKPRPDCSP